MLKQIITYSFQTLALAAITFGVLVVSDAKPFAISHDFDFENVPSLLETPVDSPDTQKKDTLTFEIEDRTTDKILTPPNSQFDLKDPSNLKTTVEYDGDSNEFSISEKIGATYYRAPSTMSFEEFMRYQSRKDENAYFRKRANTISQLSKKGGIIPKVNLGNALFDRIFGGSNIEVKPQGNVDLFFGGNWQNVKNPTLVQSAQKYGIFDFNMNMNINLLAKVGEKMRMNFNYNDRATFDFDNQMKLQYTGQDDDIIKELEAGYISFPLRTNLIQGVQSLFGIRSQLQFGRLRLNTVVSQQKSKRESLQIKGGAQTQNFSIQSDNYEDFRHFLVSHSFRRGYNKALENFPVIQSLNTINRIEVWVTNRNGITENARDIVALQDLGEATPYRTQFTKGAADNADNNANTLYQQIQQIPGTRQVGTYSNALLSLGLKQRVDFEKTFARKLNPTEFTFHPQLGFLSLNTQLQPDDVVGIAMEYTNNGKVYQVGEFSQSLPPDSSNPKLLYLKMLKSTSPDPTVPLWDLMMKNVYALGASGVSKDNFILNVMYLDPGGGEKRYLPEGPSAGIPLITLLNLDRLNNQNDPQADGRFDYIEGITINSQQGKIIFPVLEPFGEDLKKYFGGSTQLERKYLYNFLYDSTKNVAIQFPQFNRFLIKGSYQSANAAEIYLGGFNIPQGSVAVSAGGTRLTENVDYSIDYGIGKLRILNSGILNSGIPINVSYENNAIFGVQVQNFLGTRADYFINNNFTIGGTMLRLSERPFFNKVNFGEDPIKNTVLGFDANYQADAPSLTRFLDRLPIIQTSAPSMINASGEVAQLIPGHSRFINDANGQGNIYIDDFEGTRSSYDLKFPVMTWSLSSTPADALDRSGNEMFPESSLVNDWKYGKNRAKLAWYNLDPCLADPSQTCMPEHLKKDTSTLSNHYIRLVQQQDVFVNRTFTALQGNLTTLDLAYFPKQKGPYNFESSPSEINSNGELLNPQKRWAGIMRPIDFSDFETSNVEFIEFWLMDPFKYRPNDPGGSFVIDLGNISEDILKDSRKAFENGLPFPVDNSKVDISNWSKIPKFQQQLTPAFDNDPNARSAQDVGYDGMTNDEEKTQFGTYLSELSTNFTTNSKVYLDAEKDPANDDYHHFRGEDYDNEKLKPLARYTKFNNPQGNSPATTNNTQFSNAFTNIPEAEDINRDNTLNENEAYFQYRIDLKPNMQDGTNHIISKITTQVPLPNGNKSDETWYQFRIPLKEVTNRVNGIPDFKSIRFMRMYLTGFQDTTILRFARLELGRNIWRRYNFSLKNPDELIPDDDDNATLFNISSVSIEENSGRSPIPYVTPPGILRQQMQVSNAQTVLQNEQSLSIQVCDLEDGNSKGAFKALGMDMRQFKELKLFMHAESYGEKIGLRDNDVRGFIRLGSDFVSNYYEYQVPLKVTPPGTRDPRAIWPEENEMSILFEDLIKAKQARNQAGISFAIPYEVKDSKGNYIRIVGNPNLGDVKMAMLGVHNPKKTLNDPNDDGAKKCAEVWFNELRLSSLDEDGGFAAMGKVEVQLADIGNIKASGSMHTAGYGNIDQKVNQRFRDNYGQFDVAANINAGKLVPKSWGVQLPIFAGYSQTASNPIYDPYDMDVKLEDKLKDYAGAARDSVKKAAQDFTSIKSVNFQNVRVAPTHNKHKQPWDLQNFDASYSYTSTVKRNPLVENDQLDEHKASFGYTFAPKTKPIEPFKKLIPSKRKYFQLIRDFNFNLLPSNFTIRNTIDRTVGKLQLRNIDEGPYPIEPNFFKFFTWNRNYNMRWDLTKSLSFDYTAANQARIDEPYGEINTQAKKDSLRDNIMRLGRNTNFTQSFNANYNAPMSKFPLLDWTNLRGSYAATYTWTSASLLAKSLGNTIANTQTKQVNGEFNFATLYNKSKLLRTISAPKRATPQSSKQKPKSGTSDEKVEKDSKSKERSRNDSRGKSEEELLSEQFTDKDKRRIMNDEKVKKENEELGSIKDPIKENSRNDKSSAAKSGKDSLKGKDTAKGAVSAKDKKAAAKLKKKKVPYVPGDFVRSVGNLLMMVKRANFNYNENLGSTIPGYMDSTRNVGMNFGSMQPGLDYAFGLQPDRLWLEGKGRDNVLTRDSLFNNLFLQQYSQTLNLNVNVEPFKDFKVDFMLNKTFNKAHSELFKDTIGGTNDFIHLNPYETGGFNISYIAINTIFQSKERLTSTSRAFDQFERNREIISNRLGVINPYTSGLQAPEDPNYAKGYLRYSQDVLIPAFLAAYTGKDAKDYPLLSNDNSTIRSNPFKNILPMPNWRINYNGLSRTKAFKEIMQSFTLSHAYTGSLAMNSYTSALQYRDQFALGFPSFIDSISGNYVPYFLVPNMTITENFGPLLGIDATFKNSLNIHVEFKKARTLSMSLIDFQLSETKSKEITIGGGYRLKDFTINTPYFGLNKRKSDVNFKADFSLRDDYTTINRLDQREVRVTRGQKVISISPSIDYIISDNLTLRFFYDRRMSIPYVSNAFPITTTRGGVMFRFMLGQ